MQVGKDFHNNVHIAQVGIAPVAVGTTGSGNGKTTAAIDRTGYGSVEFIFGYGVRSAATDVQTVIITESDASTGGFTSVADTDLLGTEVGAGQAAVTGLTSGVSQNVFKKVGYIGTKKYVKGKVWSAGDASVPVSIVALLVNPRHAPVT